MLRDLVCEATKIILRDFVNFSRRGITPVGSSTEAALARVAGAEEDMVVLVGEELLCDFVAVALACACYEDCCTRQHAECYN